MESLKNHTFLIQKIKVEKNIWIQENSKDIDK